MRTKDEILNDLGLNKEYNPRGGIVPDLADRLMIEVFIDIRDMLVTDCKDTLNALIEIRKKH